MRGRPKLKQENKRRFFGITVSPSSASLLDKVEGNKSLFMDMLLAKIPAQWIKKFNQSPDGWNKSIQPFGK